ncbi:hypothetical protein ACFYYY_20230 [Streptomyces sp. NPDC001834]|uniref:hypothetical protein n=1 Tax=Streptomyces sp. NPDC001834 TaxID=3364616 RepID=UPI0036B8685E
MAEQIAYRRVREEAALRDGKRVLADRVWPQAHRLTLLTATRDMSHSQAAVLPEWLAAKP